MVGMVGMVVKIPLTTAFLLMSMPPSLEGVGMVGMIWPFHASHATMPAPF